MSAKWPVTYLKQFVPPILLSLIKKGKKFGWKGDYASWSDAKALSTSYDDVQILEKVKQSLLKVKNGDSVYERDGVLFDRIQYSWPLLSALLWVTTLNKGHLKVADVGGSLGSTYFQNRRFLSGVSELQWNILEQKTFVECGLQYFQDDILSFFYSPEEMIAKQGPPDILILSCVLPYLEKPYEMLENLIGYQIRYIIIDNTYFNFERRDRICIQEVPPEIYSASYPCWMLNYERIKNTLTPAYEIVSEHNNDFLIFLDGKRIQYQGLLFKIKE